MGVFSYIMQLHGIIYRSTVVYLVIVSLVINNVIINNFVKLHHNI